MSRLPQLRASRGSQRWLQEFVARHDPRLEGPISDATGGAAITWRSPLLSDDFAEYRDTEFLERINVPYPRVPLDHYWPLRGPVWDGLAITDRGTRILIEAKAHVGEMVSAMAASAPDSIATIMTALTDTAQAFGAGLTDAWTSRFYQTANRLAHLRFLRDLNGIDALLVFVYFASDADMGGPTVSGWHDAIAAKRSALGLPTERPGVIEVFIPIP